uniref:Bifunctional inhibitor/plant lipid transfer protein/seed storage helical domain-containing protein n=1 Tax=Opuntia streptacantha TaxID=393608 RepID=A0A7C8YCS9_OPUST
MAATNKSSASLALFLALNLVLCNLAFSSDTYPPPLSQCPRDALKLNVCADVLNLIHLQIGGIQKRPCCSLIGNLIKLDAAACLCTAVHANILNIIDLDLDLDLTLLVNQCGYVLPSDFRCPPRRV